jgi:hypothetical protein
MTLYCQHTYRLRLQQGPGKPDIVSERPRNRRTELFTDGPAGTQVEIPDDLAGFNLGAAIDINAIAHLPCAEHPGVPSPEVVAPAAKPSAAQKGGSGG